MTIPRPGPTDHQDSPGLELDLLWDQLCDLAEATDIAATAHIAASAPHAGHATIGHTHDATYAPIAKGVTNGDAHDHAGGDGAQIAYAGLSGLPTLGSAAALNVGTTAGTVAAGDDARLAAEMPTANP